MSCIDKKVFLLEVNCGGEEAVYWPVVEVHKPVSGFVLNESDHLTVIHLLGTNTELPTNTQLPSLPFDANTSVDLLLGQVSVVPQNMLASYQAALHSICPGNATSKRDNAISWDDYFMSVVFLSAMRSKDPSTQVGACIVNPRNRIVGIGYNGFPRGCSDDELPWARQAEEPLDTKYPYVCHAEMNAILNKNSAEAEGCSIFVGLFPCNECAKMIIQSGICEVVYLSDKYHGTMAMSASRRMLDMSGVRLRQYTPSIPELKINFS